MRHRGLWITTALVTLAAATGAGVAISGQSAPPPAAAPNTAQPGKVQPEARRAFFGELHLHTTMSFDAWTFGTKVTPDQAYKFARGETVMVPAFQVNREQGMIAAAPVPARRAWPLDFTAVTDHSEYLGAMTQLDVPGSAFSQTPIAKQVGGGGQRAFLRAGEALHGGDSQDARDMGAAAKVADGWTLEVKAANANYQPGKFTTFIAYEWTASPGQGIHMHRNVIFNGDHAPNPCVAPIVTPPFYAVQLWPSDLGTAAALVTDASARVLDGSGTPIKGLYACGNDMSSMMRGAYPGPGITLGPAIVFGFLAARDIVEKAA